jgi:hypothetical protein
VPFVKLDTGILDSTLWLQKDQRDIFITSLLMAMPREFDEEVPQLEVDTLTATGFVVPAGWYGFIPASGPGIVRRAMVDAKDGMEALRALGSPEPDSRSRDHEGRRMVRVDGGYIILNYMRFRDHDHTAADRMKRLRDRRKQQNQKNVRANTVTATPNSSQAEVRGQSTEIREESNDSSLSVAEQEEAIYKAYPRRIAKEAALKAIRKAVDRLVKGDLDLKPMSALEARRYLYTQVNSYASSPAGQSPPKGSDDYRPHPATWFNRGSYGDAKTEWQKLNGVTNGRASSQSKQDATLTAGQAVIARILGVDREGTRQDRSSLRGTGQRGAPCIDGS